MTQYLAFENPDLDTDNAISSQCFMLGIVDIGAHEALTAYGIIDYAEHEALTHGLHGTIQREQFLLRPNGHHKQF